MHTCHAFECKKVTKPEMFMCFKHWKMVPRNLQLLIWKYYRPGQCDDWQISDKYAETAKLSIKSVAEKERKTVPEDDICLKVYDHLIGK
jgi:hypothetical protein